MPMIPEDIMTGLTTLSASDNMNPRQRDLMTEGAALIKFQQHRVAEADRKQKHAEEELSRKNMEVLAMTGRVAAMEATVGMFRKHLLELAAVDPIVDFITCENQSDA